MADVPRGPTPSDPRDVPLGEVMGDVPLLRELQRVLLAGTGPINWELARQIGIAMASWGSDDPEPTSRDHEMLAATVRVAELAIADFTGLPAPPDVPHVEALRRAQWVEANARSLRDLLDPVAAKLSSAMGEVQAAQLGAFGAGEGQGTELLAGLMDRMVPLMLGAQVGAVLGYLGQRVLGQFDLAVPRDAGALCFVVPNIARFEKDWSLEPMEFRAWVALHEVTHRFEFSRPWVREHFLGLVRDLVEHAEIDLAGFQRGLETIDMADPEALSDAFEGMGNVFGQASTPEQGLRIARVQAFMAAAEGYGDHVMDALGTRMLSSYGRIAEALRRHREGRHTEEALHRLLGIETKEAQYLLGARFCERVVEQTEEATLARMWEAPETLPSMPELEEPTLWLSRIA